VRAAEGFGLDWAQLKVDETPRELTLKLGVDVPVRGRILDSEGRPVAGVRILGVSLFANSAESLDGYLATWRDVADEAYSNLDRRLEIPVSSLVPTRTTDQDGRFEIRGLGHERVALVRISATQIAESGIQAVLRKDFDPRPLNAEVARRWPQMLRPGQPALLFAPTFDFVGESARTVEGTVREEGTGRPVADALVRGDGGYAGYIASFTDAQGKYQLVGMAQSKSRYRISVDPQGETSMLSRTLPVANDRQAGPLKVDVELARGAVITGRVVDRGTGQGVPAYLRVVALPENPYPDKPLYQGYDKGFFDPPRSADGTFRVVTVPGPVVLMALTRGEPNADGTFVCPYMPASFSEADRKRVVLTELGFVSKSTPNEALNLFHAVQVLDLDEKAGAVHRELFVERGRTAEVIVEDPQGAPLAGTIVAGMTAFSGGTSRANDARCTIYALDPAKPRRVLLYHPERQLGGNVVVRGDETQPLTVRLTPTRTLQGRAVDAAGDPLPGATVTADFTADRTALGLYQYLKERYPQPRTDDDGRFELKTPIAGGEFGLVFERKLQRHIPAQPEELRKVVTQAANNTPGKVIDLGDVKLKSPQ
jgi:protocatechuate 3,4-dioxygenase beta subunit